MKDKPRIGTGPTQDRTQVYNANWAPSGTRIGDFERPWTVIGPDVFRMCATHQEALAVAIGQEVDGAPLTQEQSTAGHIAKYDHEAAWAEKQELTR